MHGVTMKIIEAEQAKLCNIYKNFTVYGSRKLEVIAGGVTSEFWW